MKQAILGLILSLGTAANAWANGEWPEFNSRGTCLYEAEDHTQVQFKFYSQDLKVEKTVDGFVVISLNQDGKQEDFGAYRATFYLSKDISGMKVKVNNDTLDIPFGKNQKVTDGDGKVAICTTSQRG